MLKEHAMKPLHALTGLAEAAVAPVGLLSDELRCQQTSQREVAHRPWPMPDRPWVMGQTWWHLLFAHWPVPPERLEGFVPPQLPLDVRDGSAWIGVTPFVVKGLRLRGTLPFPRLSGFPEINVRTYVTVDRKPGLYFLSLDAHSALAVAGARRSYRLPYFRARIMVDVDGERVNYRTDRVADEGPPARFRGSYHPTGRQVSEAEDPLGRWLAERYCLYTLDENGDVYRADIHHRPWPLQPAHADIELNTMAAPFGIDLEGDPLLHYSHRQDTVIWSIARA